MVNDEINRRLKRIYSAINAVEETDFSQFEPTITRDGQRIEIMLDFRGNLSEEDLSNLAHSLINNIANLYGHLKKWAARSGMEISKIDEIFNSSNELKIIQDLSNNDKHGYPPRNGGHSGLSPKTVGFTRGMQLTTASEEGSTRIFTLDLLGKPKIIGDGKAVVVISGEISDGDGNIIGNLHLLAKKALDAWEIILSEFDMEDLNHD